MALIVMKRRFPAHRFTTIMATTALLFVSVAPISALAADPFRTGTTARPIDSDTEAAFTAVFQRGNYPEARQYVQKALKSDPQEPMVYALAAGVAFLDNDWTAMSTYAEQTVKVAEKLMPTDPLRGNLYQGVGNFLQAAYSISEGGGGTAIGTPQALLKVQQSLDFIDKAKAVNANDPELSLLQGFLDWVIASNLGLFDPKQAIDRLQNYAAPSYLSYRGIALAYRDMRQPDQALIAVDEALKAAPDNPELVYLKAQILDIQGNKAESLKLFDQVLTKLDQLPPPFAKEITDERNRVAANQ